MYVPVVSEVILTGVVMLIASVTVVGKLLATTAPTGNSLPDTRLSILTGVTTLILFSFVLSILDRSRVSRLRSLISNCRLNGTLFCRNTSTGLLID
jgi:hypothetical protein